MKTITTLTLTLLLQFAWSQNILFVNDNNNITDNTDSILVALQNTNYGSFDYFNIPDSSSNPDLNLLSNYDLIIWYASTDGVGLGLWSNGTTGDLALKDYLIAGGRAWIIGSDILYAGGYLAPSNFNSGEFAHDFMGLASYDVQSYGDDGSLGAEMVTSTNAAPTSFPDTLTWIFPTAWWIDGVTMQAGATDMYQMGPSTYTLSGAISMAHFKDVETNVMSTFFDPALISTEILRSTFLEKSIAYLLNFDLGINPVNKTFFSLHPNPAEDQLWININSSEAEDYTIHTLDGKVIRNDKLQKKSISIAELPSGNYLITIGGQTKRFVKNPR